MFDIKKVRLEAAREIADEQAKRAKEALKAKLKQLAQAQQIVRSIENEIADLEESIADGTF
jgi:exonuclease VII small subunit